MLKLNPEPMENKWYNKAILQELKERIWVEEKEKQKKWEYKKNM